MLAVWVTTPRAARKGRLSDPRPGPFASVRQVDSDLSVADIHPAEAGDPSPATGSDHHNPTRSHRPGSHDPNWPWCPPPMPPPLPPPPAEASIGMSAAAPMATAKSSCESWISPGFDRMCSHILPARLANDPSGATARLLLSLCEFQIDHFVMAITAAEVRVRHTAPHQTA
jgi:hypothetical protein